MSMSKIKSVLALVLVAALCLGGGGVGLFNWSVATAQQPDSEDQPPQVTVKAAEDRRDTPGPVPARGALAALEQKLVGAWIGQGPCVGKAVFQSDGMFNRSGYGPGAGAFESGTWKIEWSELPPTLVMTEGPREGKDSEEPLTVHLIKLNEKHLDFRWSKDSDSRIEEHQRGTEMDNVKIRIEILDSAVQRFLGNIKHGKGVDLPPDLKTLVDTKILRSESLVDPWGKEFRYDVSGKRNKGKRPDIWTETPDKKVIDNWSERNK